MSNPTTLQDLADNLAALANSPTIRHEGPGYRTALLDTRATVLAMAVENVDHPCQVCTAPGARSYCPDCGSAQTVGGEESWDEPKPKCTCSDLRRRAGTHAATCPVVTTP